LLQTHCQFLVIVTEQLEFYPEICWLCLYLQVFSLSFFYGIVKSFRS
jgi:hypothetical protein